MDDVALNRTVDPRDAKALRAHHEDIVALLRLRPRTSRELNDISFGYRQRISELRQAGYVIRADRVDGRLFQYTLVSQPVSANGDQVSNKGTSPAADEVRTSEHSSSNPAGRIGDSSGGSIHADPVACVEDVGNDQRADRAGEETGPAADDRGRTGLVLGRWEEALAGVEVDAVICDPPYSQKTHDGHGTMERWGTGLPPSYDGANRREINYHHWTPADVDALVDGWAPRNRGWFVCMSDHVLIPAYQAAYERHGLTTFAPVGVLIRGMTVRQCGDGPSSWMLYVNVARPKALHKWGTLPGGYTGGKGEQVHIGGKPLWLMRALVRDYSRPGELVVDPCAGAASTLVAAIQEGRRCIGAEVDPDTHAIGSRRLAVAVAQPSLFVAPSTGTQASLFGGGK